MKRRNGLSPSSTSRLVGGGMKTKETKERKKKKRRHFLFSAVDGPLTKDVRQRVKCLNSTVHDVFNDGSATVLSRGPPNRNNTHASHIWKEKSYKHLKSAGHGVLLDPFIFSLTQTSIEGPDNEFELRL